MNPFLAIALGLAALLVVGVCYAALVIGRIIAGSDREEG